MLMQILSQSCPNQCKHFIWNDGASSIKHIVSSIFYIGLIIIIFGIIDNIYFWDVPYAVGQKRLTENGGGRNMGNSRWCESNLSP